MNTRQGWFERIEGILQWGAKSKISCYLAWSCLLNKWVKLYDQHKGNKIHN